MKCSGQGYKSTFDVHLSALLLFSRHSWSQARSSMLMQMIAGHSLWNVKCPGLSFSCPHISWEFLQRVIDKLSHTISRPIDLEGKRWSDGMPFDIGLGH